ncbi:unnamed protein product [Periconia digitata]|uniref:Cleavage/polyadenylation specificity factor A subunit N-terminal domain-containing protein n=1 Tax=Periconia digitata TaxID=1303443 RepID=A0A9W4XJE9_9PLEO|nr:unnamed protein product [Periconia digitata]
MAFQFQQSVLVDGEWVSRSTNAYDIMPRSHDSAAVDEDQPMLPEPTPCLGILSRTIIETPLFKFILSANIRRSGLSDVLYVGEDFVQLHEIGDYGHLRHVATKSDFKGKILAARVFGDPRKVHVSTSDRNPLLKRATIHRARTSVTGNEETVLPPDIAVLTLSSRTLMFLWASQIQPGLLTFHQKTLRLPVGHSRFDRTGNHLAIDPKGRAMAVAASEGLFVLYKLKPMDVWRKEMRDGNDGLPIVDEVIVPFEGRVMHMEFLSPSHAQDDAHVVLVFIYVDEGRTKVASYEWDFGNSLGDTMTETKKSFVIPEDSYPSLLIPLQHDSNFLLVCDNHLSLYQSVLSGPPDTMPISIPDHIRAPLHPAASSSMPQWVQWDKALRNPDFDKEVFYIAREDGRVMYVQCGRTTGIEISAEGDLKKPIDTAFAFLAVDNSEFAHCYPDVLISGGVGGDGLVHKIGAWPTEYEYAQGILGNGFSRLESIPCWAPVADMVATKVSGGRTLPPPSRASIFVTNGKSMHGEISELRRGLKALIDCSFRGMKGCTGLWVLDQGVESVEHDGQTTKQHHATFIFTLPPETIVIRATRMQTEGVIDDNDSNSAWAKGNWDIVQIPGSGDEPIQDSIMRAKETIAACILDDDYAVQISHNEVRCLHRPALTATSSYTLPGTLLRASTRNHIPYVALSFRMGNQAVIEVARIHPGGIIETDPEKRIRYNLPDDPTCVELFSFDDGDGEGILLFVGTITGSIMIFKIEHSSLKLVVSEIFPFSAAGLPTICESAVLLVLGEHRQLVCGARDGSMVLVDFAADSDGESSYPTHTQQHSNIRIKSREPVQMGSTAVQLRPCSTDPSSAFLACGSEFCRITLSGSGPRAIDVNPIWLVDRHIQTYAQGPIVALDQLPFVPNSASTGRGLGGFIFTVSGEQMLLAQMDYDVRWSGQNGQPAVQEQSKVVPRTIPTGASPMKMMYMAGTTRFMVVATMENKEVRAPPNGYRTVHSTLKFLKMSEEQMNEEPDIKSEDEELNANKFVAYEFQLEPYERVYSMVEWVMDTDKGKKYKILVVGTGIKKGPGQEEGRRLFFNAGGKSGVKLMKQIPHTSPVRCLGIYKSTYLVAIIGKTIRIYDFEAASQKWSICVEAKLPSNGVHMTISDSFVYISTSNDSLICYQILHIEQMEQHLRLKKLFTDSRERPSTHHLVYDVPASKTFDDDDGMMSADDFPASARSEPTSRLVLLADKACSVTGLFHPSPTSQKLAAPMFFEAELPRSVIRLYRADVRPPWRRSYVAYPLKEWPTRPPHAPYGILADDILGATSDGTIYSFSILSVPALRVLRFIQNLLVAKRKRDPALQYSSAVGYGQHQQQNNSDIFDVLLRNSPEGAREEENDTICARDVDPRVHGPEDDEDVNSMDQGVQGGQARAMHVDGDLLIRWWKAGDRSSSPDLLTLLRDGCEDRVETVFCTLFLELLGCPDYAFMAAWEIRYPELTDKKERLIRVVEDWLGDVLLDVL